MNGSVFYRYVVSFLFGVKKKASAYQISLKKAGLNLQYYESKTG